MTQKRSRAIRGVAAGLAAFAVFVVRQQALAGSTGEIIGTVTDRLTQRGVAGATVTLVSSTGAYRTTTNRDGFFAVVDAFPSAYVVSVSSDAYATTQQYSGAVNPDQTIVVNVQLDTVPSQALQSFTANPLSLVQPSLALDRYVLTSAAMDSTNGSGGSYGLYQLPGIVGTLPGATVDEGVNLHLRGSRLNEVGFEYDGVSAVEPITGLTATNLIQDGVVRLHVTEGGDTSSIASAPGGVVNSVVGIGSYPPHGSVSTFVQSPTFYHGTNFQYGSATPDRRFSWFASGVLWNSGYDWGRRGSFVPGVDSLETALGDGPLGDVAPSRDQVLNLHYRPGDSRDDAQFLAASGFERFDSALAARYWPSTNPLYGPSTNSAPANGLCNNNGLALFPGQASCTAAMGSATDHIDQRYTIDKLRFTHELSSGSSLAVGYARVATTINAYLPFADGPFADLWETKSSGQQQFSAEYRSQVGAKNFFRAGIATDFSNNYMAVDLISNGYGLITPTGTDDRSFWLSDEFRSSSQLTIEVGARAVSRTYDRLAAPTFSESGTEGEAGLAYTFLDGTIVRAAYGNHAALPFASSVERIQTRAPNFQDTGAANRLQLLEAQPAVPQSHTYDASIERQLLPGVELKVTPFWRASPNVIVTNDVALSLPQAAGMYRVHGLDVETQFLHTNGSAGSVTGYVNYTHTRALAQGTGDYAQPVSAGATAAGALFPVAYIAPDVANVVLTWHRKRWTINPEINYSSGYPFGIGRFTYNSLNCPNAAPGDVGDPSRPCGAVVANPAAHSDTIGGNCGPGACAKLLDPTESRFADGRVCCSSLTANLNVYYDLSSRTQLGLQWQNLGQNYRALAMAQNPYYPHSAYGPPGFNGYFNYGATPYIPVANNTSEELLFMITQKL